MTWSPWQLAYCSNVHPAPRLAGVQRVIREEIAAVRRLRGLERMGTGLWLSASAVAELLASPEALDDLPTDLAEQGLALFTLNGFPYGDFHGASVKQAVYQPDWSEHQRLDYTLDLARILALCLPGDCPEGSISTLPLGFAAEWDPAKQMLALNALCQVAQELARLADQSGCHIRVCLEMEPGCVLETTPQVIELFTEQLPQAAKRLGIPQVDLDRHLGLCYDICHQAVMFEDIPDSLRRISAAGISIGKIQVSSALEWPRPSRAAYADQLRPFAEPRYLHQVRGLGTDGRTLYGRMDLPTDEDFGDLPSDQPWRVHFHVPIQSRQPAIEGLTTTQQAIEQVLDFLATDDRQHPHLEVETYTWQVLPEALRPTDADGLRAGIAAELDWLQDQLAARSLLA